MMSRTRLSGSDGRARRGWSLLRKGDGGNGEDGGERADSEKTRAYHVCLTPARRARDENDKDVGWIPQIRTLSPRRSESRVRGDFTAPGFCTNICYMRRNSRLSAALHAILHMAERKKPMTSDDLGACLQTNPVVVRRTMSGLRDAGVTTSGRGHGGGWTLARDLADISLRDVYGFLGEPVLFRIGSQSESPGCLVEQAVNAALGDALDAAEAVFRARLGSISLAELEADVRRRFAAQQTSETAVRDAV